MAATNGVCTAKCYNFLVLKALRMKDASLVPAGEICIMWRKIIRRGGSKSTGVSFDSWPSWILFRYLWNTRWSWILKHQLRIFQRPGYWWILFPDGSSWIIQLEPPTVVLLPWSWKASTRNLTGKGMRPDHLEMDKKKLDSWLALPVNGVYLAEPKQFMFKQVKQTSVSWSNHGVFVVIHHGNPWSKWICFNPNRWWPCTSIAQSNFWPWHKTISAYLFLHQET